MLDILSQEENNREECATRQRSVAKMRTLQIIFWAAEVVSFTSMIITGNSITREVSEAMGESRKRIWSADGNKIWRDHEQLFPVSQKRLLFAITLVSALGFLLAGAYLVR